MTLFTVHAPPTEDLRDASLGVRLVRHKFSWTAFSLGPLWLLSQRLWLPAFLNIIAVLALTFAVGLGYLSPPAGYLVMLAMGFLIGLDGPEWVRRRMVRRGLGLRGVCLAGDETQAYSRAFNLTQAQRHIREQMAAENHSGERGAPVILNEVVF